MTNYKMPLPHAALGIAALALSAATLALSVYVPATFTNQDGVQMLAAPHVEGGFREVNIEPARINVVANCPQKMALEQARQAAPKHDQSS